MISYLNSSGVLIIYIFTFITNINYDRSFNYFLGIRSSISSLFHGITFPGYLVVCVVFTFTVEIVYWFCCSVSFGRFLVVASYFFSNLLPAFHILEISPDFCSTESPTHFLEKLICKKFFMIWPLPNSSSSPPSIHSSFINYLQFTEYFQLYS